MKTCKQSTTTAPVTTHTVLPQPVKKRKYDAVSARRTRMINKQRKLQGKPPLRRARKTNRKYVYSGKYVTKNLNKIRKFKGVLGERMRTYQKNLDGGKVSSVGCHAESPKEKGSSGSVAPGVRPTLTRTPPIEV